MTTKFEKDYQAAKQGDSSVMYERKKELDKLIKEGKSCKNKFRMQCIAQEVVKLQNEYKVLDKLF